MKLKDIGDLANLIAGVGVILSLLFVGYQIRQNTEETRAANAAAVGQSFRELVLTRAHSPSLAEAIATVNAGEDATRTQNSQYQAYFLALLRTVEDAYLQYREGRLDESQVRIRLAAASIYLRRQAGRERYEQLRTGEVFSEDFIQWLDEQLAEQSRE